MKKRNIVLIHKNYFLFFFLYTFFLIHITPNNNWYILIRQSVKFLVKNNIGIIFSLIAKKTIRRKYIKNYICTKYFITINIC